MMEKSFECTTLRDTLPASRPRWADLKDTQSNESLGDSVPPAPLFHSNSSQLMSCEDLGGGSQVDLARKLERAAVLGKSPSKMSDVGDSQHTSSVGATGSGLVRSFAGNLAVAADIVNIATPVRPLDATVERNTLQSSAVASAATRPSGLTRSFAKDLGSPDQRGSMSNAEEPLPTRQLNPNATEFVPSTSSTFSPHPAQAVFSPHDAEAYSGFSSEPAVRRRIPRKRSVKDLGDMNGKRPRPSEVEPEATEEDWQRRNMKRRAAVEGVKETPEYQAMRVSLSMHCDRSPSRIPRTPDPDNREVSKRGWESSVMRWRTDVKSWGTA